MDIILLGVVAVLAVWLIMSYNKFVKLIEGANNSEKAISIQLDARGKKFDSLVSAVSRYMKHEEETFSKIAELRSIASQGNASNSEAVKNAENELTNIVKSGQLSHSINIAVEDYPELNSHQNMMQLQEEIVNVENKLEFAKKAYNHAVEVYNIKKKKFPDLLVPKIVSSVNKDFEYWSLSEEEIVTQEAKRVSF